MNREIAEFMKALWARLGVKRLLHRLEASHG